MLTFHEMRAFCLAPASAPVVAAMVLGSSSPWVVVAVVAYLAAFVFGVPLFIYLRYRDWPLAARCLLAAAIAGLLSALLLVTTLLLAFSVSRFLADPATTAVFLGVGAAWGLGLGLVAGTALFALLRARGRSYAAA
jgi:hypothetical protein